ncbi:MAG: ATPase central domain protein [Acidobacteria bacterium]|nr:ATPase central domain protein [Acidobacteriota bacterium]
MNGQEWLDANQRHLAAAMAELRGWLEAKLRGETAQPPNNDTATFALEHVATMFGLSSFERRLLMLCAAIELDSAIASLCATLQGDPSRVQPTFSLALAVLPDAHWSAITPAAPLRRWRLIELAGSGPLTTAPLRIDERVLHFLTGIDHVDERLMSLVEPLPADAALSESQRGAADRIAAIWSSPSQSRCVQLCGGDDAVRRAVAAAACAKVGLTGFAASALALPQIVADSEALARLWQRDAWLGGAALFLDCDGVDTADRARVEALRQFVARIDTPLIVATREPRELAGVTSAIVEIQRSQPAEQRQLWLETLGETAQRFDGHIDRVSTQFQLSPAAMRGVAASIAGLDDPGPRLWEGCRVASRRRLDELAQRIVASAEWCDLVVPVPLLATLRDIATSVRYRSRVYDEWGFSARGARGLGVTALFSGASGTGKTLAAEVLANELQLDLYRIDLSGVVSKYIGDTEKNLRSLFDAAEDGGAILLFDEADALFGKRSEVRDSHDRYANIEVSYLLQRMEAYRGLAILTTNFRDAIDQAFLRRLRYAVNFPFPAAADRAEIWRRTFPATLPTEGIDVDKLAHLSIAGGNIRNIAVNAAFGAARDATPVTMRLLREAARAEYAKLEKTLAGSEVDGWV